jgi:hypothetical protein
VYASATINLFSLPDKDVNGGVERHKGKPEHQKHVELLHKSDGHGNENNETK